MLNKVYRIEALHLNTEVYNRYISCMELSICFFFRMHFELRILLRRLPRKYGKDVARSWANTLGAALRVPGSIKFLGHLPSSCYTQYSTLQALAGLERNLRNKNACVY